MIHLLYCILGLWVSGLFFDAFPDESGQFGYPSFQAQEIDANVAIGYGLAIGDVDGDGRPDILLADKKQFVWYRNPDWQRYVMIDSLTERDNVCLAARDIDGDGRVEVAVGAQWNPGETIDARSSGSVHFLLRPKDPSQLWEAIRLPHEPTVHRMQWVETGAGFRLVVLPLHGRGNRGGRGAGVQVLAYEKPEDPHSDWKLQLIDSSMHQTHNFDLLTAGGAAESLLIGGKEGAKMMTYSGNKWEPTDTGFGPLSDAGFGEIRAGHGLIAGIQPMHGNSLAIYRPGGQKTVLTDSLKQGHALACADLLGEGRDQVVVGWRQANDAGQVGILLFRSRNEDWSAFDKFWIDQNGMACEDLKLADLDLDGRMDIIAAGRGTHNLKIYWNRSRQ